MNRRSVIVGAASLTLARPALGWQKRRLNTANRRYFEFTLLHGYVSGFDAGAAGFGICGATASLTNAGQWVNNSMQPAEAQLSGLVVNTEGSGRPVGYPARCEGPSISAADGTVYATAVNITAGLQWLRNVSAGGIWFGNGLLADPATDTSGFDYTSVITGAVYAWGGATQRNNTNYGSGVNNLGGSAFIGTVPTGYIAWGASDTLNPADKSGSLTLSGGNLTWSSLGSGDLLEVLQLARSIQSLT